MSLTVTDKKALILDALIQAAIEEGAVAASKGDDYHVGETMGWYRILSIIIDEAESYGVPTKELGLNEYNPDELLMAIKSKQAA
jgi:hypothetical protein